LRCCVCGVKFGFLYADNVNVVFVCKLCKFHVFVVDRVDVELQYVQCVVLLLLLMLCLMFGVLLWWLSFVLLVCLISAF
jgi:hypothetical protein